MKTIAFFNNKGGVGKTSLVYHLAWMYSELGIRTIAADFDPQANLTSMFLDENRLEELWPENGRVNTVYGAIQPILEGTGDIGNPHIDQVQENLWLLVGDLQLSASEEDRNPESSIELPSGSMLPIGYIVENVNCQAPRGGNGFSHRHGHLCHP